jgi:hypothetical protein
MVGRSGPTYFVSVWEAVAWVSEDGVKLDALSLVVGAESRDARLQLDISFFWARWRFWRRRSYFMALVDARIAVVVWLVFSHLCPILQ